MIPNVDHGVWDGQVLQRRATLEGIILNVGHGVWDGQLGQCLTTKKCPLLNLSFIAWDFDCKQQHRIYDTAQTSDLILVGASHRV